METALRFNEEQLEVLRLIAEQVASSPETLGLEQSQADEIYDIVFERN